MKKVKVFYTVESDICMKSVTLLKGKFSEKADKTLVERLIKRLAKPKVQSIQHPIL